MKFGKYLQRRQLEIPEYSAAFVNYKGLKKLIKQLSATPVLAPQNAASSHTTLATLDPQASLQANKGTFFFKVEREIEKVNACYLQKEAELRLRLKLLTDKKVMMKNAPSKGSRNSANLRNLLQGFQQFNDDLSKLQQYIDVNGTAFAKILKKWDKTSKSKTKELYLSRAVEVQPFFNQDILRQLSDQATTDRLELEAWAEGERLNFGTTLEESHTVSDQSAGSEYDDTDNQILHASNTGEMETLRGWISRLKDSPEAKTKLTRTFLFSIADAPFAALELLIDSKQVDVHAKDEISERNCLHEAAISGRADVLTLALRAGVDSSRRDIYGRVPLHYACLHGHADVMVQLLENRPETVDELDHGKYTPLIHAVVHRRLECVQWLLQAGARIEPEGENDHIPLNLACQHGSREITRLLLERDAKILADAEGLYPQHLVARSKKQPEILELLELHGADLDQKDKLYQWTPLFHAASEGCESTLKVLLDKGVDVDTEDEKGLLAVYYAVWEGHLECMQLLTHAHLIKKQQQQQQQNRAQELQRVPSIRRFGPQEATSVPPPVSMEHDGIPDLELPPPIIPMRRYGHNFLDSKAFIQITFDAANPDESRGDAIMFYHDNKYPAARLTISSKSSDLIPRNITLPLQDEDSRRMSFQVDNLETFTLEFDIYPTFGARRIAHGVALPDVFSAKESSKGTCVVPLFDSRLRAIGRIEFRFQVVKPCTFPGAPVDLAVTGSLETYWKSTTLDSHQPDSLVTGSSLTGEYVTLFVQLTKDGVPILYPRWSIQSRQLPFKPVVACLNLDEFKSLARYSDTTEKASLASILSRNPTHPDLTALYTALAFGHLTLAEALEQLPQSVHVALNVLYPSPAQEKALSFSSALNINDYADAILRVVFDHARRNRGGDEAGFVRSFAFTSWNADICAALNWKQPNYPVMLCNDLGTESVAARMEIDGDASVSAGTVMPIVKSDGRVSISIKEAVRIAQDNNLMGLVCSSRLLKLVPALTQSIKVAGLVLVSDTSFDDEHTQQRAFTIPSGVDGLMTASGILRFNDSVEIS